jgi:outer membrane protein assembly factor BamB
MNDVLYLASEAGAPSAEGNQEATGPTGWLTAYNAATGDQLWQETTPAPLYATPVVVDNSIVVALQSTEALLIGFDLDTGNEQWRYTPPAAS